MLFTGRSITHPLSSSPTSHPTATEAPSPLTGRLVPVSEARRYPLAVMIENHPDARPQSGLADAGLVYEAYAEGGITRFMAVYVEGNITETIGPVRSVRTYYLDWATEIKAILAHVGGNMDALDLISSSNVYNLDQFANGSTYWRDNNRYAPHNVYTTLQRLRDTAKANGDNINNPSYPTFHYKDPAPVASRPESAEFSVNYGGSYNVKWVYDKAGNTYSRYIAGTADVDAANSKQIKASNIIVQVVPQANIITRIGEQGLKLDTVGTGAAKVVADGVTIDATWKKLSGQKTRFYDSSGKEIKLNRGVTWIEIVPPWVTYG